MSSVVSRAGTNVLKLVMSTFIVLALIAVVVSMSNARSGTIHASVSAPSKVTGSLNGAGQLVLPSYCSSANAHCGSKGLGRSGTALLSAELAVGLILVVSTAVFLWMARRQHLVDEASPALANALQPSQSIRRQPADNREVVLSAFADLEDHLAELGFVREPWESAEGYLARAMPNAWRDGHATHRLARFYALARYSHHPIDSITATQAITDSRDLVVLLGRSLTPGVQHHSAAEPECPTR